MNLSPLISSYISIISPCILHIVDNKGGLIVFVKSHIPSRRLTDFKIRSKIQIIPFEINFRKEKWLVALVPVKHIFSLVFIRILLNSL